MSNDTVSVIPASNNSTKGSRVAPKPDFEKHTATVNSLNEQIDTTKSQLNKIRQRITALSSNGSETSETSAQSQREALRSKLNSIKKSKLETQREHEDALRRVATLQEGIDYKKQELKQIITRLGYSTSQEVQDRIAHLDAQIQTGHLKLIQEKKAIQELTQLKRCQPLLDTIATKQTEISRDETELKSLQTKLATESNSSYDLDQSYDKVKRELHSLTEPIHSKYNKLGSLYQERDQLSQQLSSLLTERSKVQDAFRIAKEEHYRTLREDRARKQAQFLQDKKRLEMERLTALAREEREQAEIPAFSEEIQICTNLITYIKSTVGIKGSVIPGDEDDGTSTTTNTNTSTTTTTSSTRTSVTKQHNLRKVEAPTEVTILKRGDNREETDLLFVGVNKKKGKHNNNNKGSKSNQSGGTTSTDVTNKSSNASTTTTPTTSFKFPLSVLEQFWLVKVDVPVTYSAAESTIQALVERRAWYSKHSLTVTERNIALAEAKIQKLLSGQSLDNNTTSASGTNLGKDDNDNDEADMIDVSNDGDMDTNDSSIPGQVAVAESNVEGDQIDSDGVTDTGDGIESLTV